MTTNSRAACVCLFFNPKQLLRCIFVRCEASASVHGMSGVLFCGLIMTVFVLLSWVRRRSRLVAKTAQDTHARHDETGWRNALFVKLCYVKAARHSWGSCHVHQQLLSLNVMLCSGSSCFVKFENAIALFTASHTSHQNMWCFLFCFLPWPRMTTSFHSLSETLC